MAEGEVRDQRGCRTVAGSSGSMSPPLRKDAPMTASVADRRAPGWFTADDCRLEDFRAVVETTTDLADSPYADEVGENVLVDGTRLRGHNAPPRGRRDVQAELARALADGPGIVVF